MRVSLAAMDLLEFTERGIYCQKAGIFIDPSRSVPNAFITHAHSDHAQAGCQQYLCTRSTAMLLRFRLGLKNNIKSIDYGEKIYLQGVEFSFHPAGHIPGSAQIRVEHRGEVWVVSGDYKVHTDQVSEQFELLKCHTFITESTFGLPIYQWPAPEIVFKELNSWWASNAERGVTSVISAYALGKSQRILQNVDDSIGPLFCHQSVEDTNAVLRGAGVQLRQSTILNERPAKELLQRALVIVPGSALSSSWMRRVKEYSTAAASGWMILKGRKQWQHVDRGFVLSDHVDWPGLNSTISATGCEKVIVTHGYTDIYAKWLRAQGYDAYAEKTGYQEDGEITD